MATISLPARAGLWQRLQVLPLTDALLGASAMVVLGSWLVLALTHLGDSYGLNHVSSVYTTVAASFHDGRFYGPLLDDGHYGGCRYMPLQPALHAGLSFCTHDYLISGKLLTYLLTVILLVELVVILHAFGCRPGLCLALASLVLVTRPGFLAVTTIRGDLLPVVLQMGALLAVSRSPGWRGFLFAALLCCLALLAKQTAAWAGAAICLSCWPKHWRLGASFLAAWLGSFAVALGILHLASHGQMAANFAAAGQGGLSLMGLALSPFNLIYRLSRGDVAAVFMVPALVVGCAAAWRPGQMTLYHRAVFFCVPILLVIFADNGSDYNHLLDLVVLAVPVIGCLLCTVAGNSEGYTGARIGVPLVLVWVLFAGWAGSMERGLREVVMHRGEMSHRYPVRPLAAVLPQSGSIFSEDPWVEVARGRRPVCQDPFALAVIGRKHPELTTPLIQRLEQGDFSRVVLLRRLDKATGDDMHEWYQRHFGPAIVRAIAQHYQLVAQAEGYFIYAPIRRAPSDRASLTRPTEGGQ